MDVRKEAKEYVMVRSAINKLLDGWDPIGVYRDGDGPGPEEYDDLAEMVMVGLRAGATGAKLRRLVEDAVARHYGMPGTGVPRPLIEQIQAGWQTSSLGSAALDARALAPPSGSTT